MIRRMTQPAGAMRERAARDHRRHRALDLCALAALGASACSRDHAEAVDQGPALQAYTTPTTTLSFRKGALPADSYASATDTTLRKADPTTNFGSSDTCGATADDASGSTSCVMRWHITGVPAAARVESARISVQVLDGTSDVYHVFELTRSFDELRASWELAGAWEPWGTPGALAGSDRGRWIGTLTGGPGSRAIELNAAGVALVQSWVNGSINHGVIITSGTSTDGIEFASSEAAATDDRPRLDIAYTTSTEGAAAAEEATVTASTSRADSADSGALGSARERSTATAQDLLVAFIGDQGNNGNASSVLTLILEEGADAIVHNGDFDYRDNPAAWEDRINSVLGPDFPYFAVIGNHDALGWPGPDGYAAKIAARHARVPEMECSGEIGVKANCHFRGLHLVQSCVGTDELRSSCGADSKEQVDFIRESLAADDAIFSVCNWHKNQHDMQVGTKRDEVGWSAYQVCMDAGAIIATGHEHSYSRTLTLTDLGNAGTRHGATGAFDVVELRDGSTFAFVSGLAGAGIRNFSASDHADDGWWASYYTGDRWHRNGVDEGGYAAYGALFIRFNADGNPRRANAYFKDVNGRVVDEFTIVVP